MAFPLEESHMASRNYQLESKNIENKIDIRQTTLCFFSSAKTKELAASSFSPIETACNYFQSQGINFGFYSCKHLRKIIFLAPKFHCGTCSASQVHTSLIEKTPAAAAAAAALWQPQSLAANTTQQMQRSHKNC